MEASDIDTSNSKCKQPQFASVSPDELEALDDIKMRKNVNIKTNNHCPDCPGVSVELTVSESICPQCHRVFEHNDAYKSTSSSTRRVKIGSGTQYVEADKIDIVQKRTLEFLSTQNNNFTLRKIDKHILQEVASSYAQLYSEHAGVVKRGKNKREMLATMLLAYCKQHDDVRKENEIALFMGLNTAGFSRGEKIISHMEAEGLCTLPHPDNDTRGFARKFITALFGSPNQHYIDFVCDVIDETVKLHIGVSSQTTSKVAGCIWLIVLKTRVGIASKAVEQATDNTKVNTFTKFAKLVLGLIASNIPNDLPIIFARHGIPID